MLPIQIKKPLCNQSKKYKSMAYFLLLMVATKKISIDYYSTGFYRLDTVISDTYKKRIRF
jgi:hypothetical protein